MLINRITKVETAGEEKIRLYEERYGHKIPIVTLYKFAGKDTSKFSYTLWINDTLMFFDGCTAEILKNIENEEYGIIKSKYMQGAYYLIERRQNANHSLWRQYLSQAQEGWRKVWKFIST